MSHDHSGVNRKQVVSYCQLTVKQMIIDNVPTWRWNGHKCVWLCTETESNINQLYLGIRKLDVKKIFELFFLHFWCSSFNGTAYESLCDFFLKCQTMMHDKQDGCNLLFKVNSSHRGRRLRLECARENRLPDQQIALTFPALRYLTASIACIDRIDEQLHSILQISVSGKKSQRNQEENQRNMKRPQS